MILISFQINIKKNLDFKVPKNIEEKLFLIDSGKPKETTKEMVNFVATQNVANIFEKIEITTKAIIESIKSENNQFTPEKVCLQYNQISI